MSHYPECFCHSGPCVSVGGSDMYHDTVEYCQKMSPPRCRCGDRCICDRIQAAMQQQYQRGKEDAYNEMTDERRMWPGPRGFDYDKGRAAALDEAIQAVEAQLRLCADSDPMQYGLMLSCDVLRALRDGGTS